MHWRKGDDKTGDTFAAIEFIEYQDVETIERGVNHAEVGEFGATVRLSIEPGARAVEGTIKTSDGQSIPFAGEGQAGDFDVRHTPETGTIIVRWQAR